MKWWPWVSRQVALLRENERLAMENANLRADIAILARFDALLEKYVAAVSPKTITLTTPTESLELPVKREPSIVSQVIREQSGGDPRLAAHLRTYAGKLKREGADENQIAYALGVWVSTEPDTQVI